MALSQVEFQLSKRSVEAREPKGSRSSGKCISKSEGTNSSDKLDGRRKCSAISASLEEAKHRRKKDREKVCFDVDA